MKKIKYNKKDFNKFLEFLGVDRGDLIDSIKDNICPPGILEYKAKGGKCLSDKSENFECEKCWNIYLEKNLED